MSNEVFPVLPGLAWSVIKTPTWSTKIQRSVGGRELRASYFSKPIWNFKLSYEILRADSAHLELQSLMAFFNLRKGSYDSFFYADPYDTNVASQSFGTGDGTTSTFKLFRSISTFTEPVGGVYGTTQIYKNGVLQSSGYTVNENSGTVTFSVAPANGVALTWTGSFYYRCRFAKDDNEFENFMRDLWSAKKVELVSIK